jgi:hypothetical protein
VKQIVYNVRIHNFEHLKQRIREAAASITPDLGRVWQEMNSAQMFSEAPMKPT